MKTSTIVGLGIGAGVLLWLVLELEAPLSVQLIAGQPLFRLATPKNGKIAVHMPAGGTDWAMVALTAAGQAPEQLAIPPGTAPAVVNVAAGDVLVVMWHMANGTNLAQLTMT